MLASKQRVRPEDKPLADLAIKAYEKCKAAVAGTWAMLPPQANVKMVGVAQQIDALVTKLYAGKITFGEYNVKRIQLLRQMALAFESSLEGPAASAVVPAQSAEKAPNPTPTVQNPVPQTSASHEVRIALVIVESRYLNLPKLINPESDAHSIAETLQKMGYDTRLLLDAPKMASGKKFENLPASQAKPKLP